MASFTHDPNNITVNIGGVPVGGLSQDVFASIAYAGPSVAMRKTLAGDVIYSVNRADAATVTLTCEPNSVANSLLTASFQTQKRTGGGQFVFSIINNNIPDGLAVFICPAARVEKMPDRSFGAEAQTIEWTILCGEVEHLEAALPTDGLF